MKKSDLGKKLCLFCNKCITVNNANLILFNQTARLRLVPELLPSLKQFQRPADCTQLQQMWPHSCDVGWPWLRLDLPGVGEAVPHALAVAPEQPVEDAIKKPVEVKALYVWLLPDPLQH